MEWPTAKIRRHNQAVRDSESTAQLDSFDASDTVHRLRMGLS